MSGLSPDWMIGGVTVEERPTFGKSELPPLADNSGQEVAVIQNGSSEPGNQKSAKQITAALKWEEFRDEVQSREHDFAALLPPNLRIEKFIAAAVAAVKKTPEILFADKRSLFAALIKAAQDGLLPDGKEGIINIYNTKQKDGSYLPIAQWNPMTYGIRKRARELDGILIDAQVVYELDHFIWHQGDDPKIEHVPAKLGTERGIMLGAYAIFKREDGLILHREVMSSVDIELVREQSKDPDSLMWKKFTGEAYRKTALRRGSKSVPVSEALESIIRRDDDSFDFDEAKRGRAVVKDDGTVTPPKPSQSAFERAEDITAQPKTPEPVIQKEAPQGSKEDAGRSESAPMTGGNATVQASPGPHEGQNQGALPLEELTPDQKREQAWQDYRADLHREIPKITNITLLDDFEARQLPEFKGRPQTEADDFKQAIARRAVEIRNQSKRK